MGNMVSDERYIELEKERDRLAARVKSLEGAISNACITLRSGGQYVVAVDLEDALESSAAQYLAAIEARVLREAADCVMGWSSSNRPVSVAAGLREEADRIEAESKGDL